MGYDYKQLREHIETGWPWTKTRKGWEIDHIFPISAFVDYGISNLKIINCLENLRPLTRKANRKKRAIYNKSLFEQWLKQKGIETPI